MMGADSLPLLTRVSDTVEDETLLTLLSSMERRVGAFRIDIDGDPTARDGWLCWNDQRSGQRRRIRYSIPDALRNLLTIDAEATGAGIERVIRAAVDPRRRVDRRTGEMRLGALLCAAVSELVPTPRGNVDTVEVLLPNPWSGLIAARISLPPFSSGVTSMDNEFRTVHPVPELTQRVDTAIAPTALINPAVDHRERTVHVFGGYVCLHRRVTTPDAMERLRGMAELDRLLLRGIVQSGRTETVRAAQDNDDEKENAS